MDCIFCKIAAKQIKSSIVYEGENILAFDDVNPKAPVHVLVIPKKHIAKIQDICDADKTIMGEIAAAIPKIAKLKSIDEDGYRTIINNGKNAGQDVFHLHVHIMGGRKFSWPPG